MSAESIDIETLSYCVRQLLFAKSAEEKAKAHRIEIEEKIAKYVPGPERGQKTVTLPDGKKVTVERGFNYKAQCDAIETLCAENGLALPIKIKTTKELDVAGYEWYRENDADSFKSLSAYVVATPKKIAVSVKEPK